MDTPHSFIVGFMNMASSVDTNFSDQTRSSNILSDLPNVIETSIWTSNAADYSSKQVGATMYQQISINDSLNQLKFMAGFIESNVSTLILDHIALASNDTWMMDTCWYASNLLSEPVGMWASNCADFVNDALKLLLQGAVWASNNLSNIGDTGKLAWACNVGMSVCSNEAKVFDSLTAASNTLTIASNTFTLTQPRPNKLTLSTSNTACWTSNCLVADVNASNYATTSSNMATSASNQVFSTMHTEFAEDSWYACNSMMWSSNKFKCMPTLSSLEFTSTTSTYASNEASIVAARCISVDNRLASNIAFASNTLAWSSNFIPVKSAYITQGIACADVAAVLASNILMASNSSAWSSNNTRSIPRAFRNVIINGDMRIDQRNVGSLLQCLVDVHNYSADMWSLVIADDNDAQVTIQQVQHETVSRSSLFKFSLCVTYLNTVKGFVSLNQNVECFHHGLDTRLPMFASFLVKSTAEGSMAICATIEHDASFISAFEVSVANSWQQVNISIPFYPGSRAEHVVFTIYIGSSKTFDTSGQWKTQTNLEHNDWITFPPHTSTNVTGIQLENWSGPTSTCFDVRPFDIEMNMCMRYFQKSYDYSNPPGKQNSISDSIRNDVTAFSKAVGNSFFIPFQVLLKPTGIVSICYSPVSGRSGMVSLAYVDTMEESSNVSLRCSSQGLTVNLSHPFEHLPCVIGQHFTIASP